MPVGANRSRTRRPEWLAGPTRVWEEKEQQAKKLKSSGDGAAEEAAQVGDQSVYGLFWEGLPRHAGEGAPRGLAAALTQGHHVLGAGTSE